MILSCQSRTANEGWRLAVRGHHLLLTKARLDTKRHGVPYEFGFARSPRHRAGGCWRPYTAKASCHRRRYPMQRCRSVLCHLLTALIRETGGSKAPKASSGSSPLPLARPPGPFAAPAAKTHVSFPDAAMATPWAGATGRSNSTPRMGFPSRPVDPLQGASYPDLGLAISWPQTNSDLIRWEPNSIMFPSWPACPHKQNTETHQKIKQTLLTSHCS